MADLTPKPVHLFPPVAGGITATTKIPLGQRSNLDDPDDLHFTPEDIKVYLESTGMIAVPSGGEYANDDEAAAANVAIGKWYVLTDNNSYNLPGGIPKKRRV